MNPRKIRLTVFAISAIILLCNSGTVSGEDEEEAQDTETATEPVSTDSGDPVCSVSEADATQTCISIKFPWKEDAVYFCTENEKITYATQCGENRALKLCNHDHDKDDLKISTPWECCPFISKPNRCEDEVCPPVPFNRTCTSSKEQHECCPRYFCEKGDVSKCKLKMSQSSCVNPPKGKKNCTAFIDPYGCCKKFQCLGDGKEGECPPEMEKSQFLHKVIDGASATLDGDYVKAGKKLFHIHEEQKCTGDWTCPGTMKCCPTYSGLQKLRPNKDKKGKGKSKPIIPANGICMKPLNADGNGDKGSTETEGGKEKEGTEAETETEKAASSESNTHADSETRDQQSAGNNPISALLS